MKKDSIRLAVWSTLFLTFGLILLFTSKSNEEKNKKLTKENKLFSLKASDISKIQINTKENKITIEKENDTWTITKPKQFDTMQSEVDKWTTAFSRINTADTFESDNINQFGIQFDNYFYAKDKSSKEYKLILGSKTPDGLHYYAKTKQFDNKIFLIRKRFVDKNTLDIPLLDFREKDFLKLKEDDIKYISFNDMRFEESSIAISKLNNMPKNIALPSDMNISYDENRKVLMSKGPMSIETNNSLLKLNTKKDPSFKNAIEKLFTNSNKKRWGIKTLDKKTNEEETHIDTNKTSYFVNDILNIRARDFIEKKSAKKKIAFNKKNTLVFSIKTREKNIKLYITLYKDKVYAKKLNDKKTIYTLGEHIFDRLNKDKEYFLLKEVKKKIKKKKNK